MSMRLDFLGIYFAIFSLRQGTETLSAPFRLSRHQPPSERSDKSSGFYLATPQFPVGLPKREGCQIESFRKQRQREQFGLLGSELNSPEALLNCFLDWDT
jgi:hypothetical protein